MTKQTDEIAELKARIAKLEAQAKAVPAPPPYDPIEAERSTRAWVDQMHQMREGRANIVPDWLKREVAGGVTDADARDLVRSSHAPQGPSAQGAIPSSQQMSNIRGTGGVPGGGTGWAREIPLSASPDQRHSLSEWINPKARETKR